jgi:hypothetical protein
MLSNINVNKSYANSRTRTVVSPKPRIPFTICHYVLCLLQKISKLYLNWSTFLAFVFISTKSFRYIAGARIAQLF